MKLSTHLWIGVLVLLIMEIMLTPTARASDQYVVDDSNRAAIAYSVCYGSTCYVPGTPGSDWKSGLQTGCCYADTITKSKTIRATASFIFNGDHIVFGFIRAANAGKAAIYIDGVYEATVDQYGSPRQMDNIGFYFLDGSSPHTITVQVTGQRNPASTDTFVNVDYFAVNCGEVEAPYYCDF
jgi:hypothetical protein